jgi:hypothetical protein
MTDPTGYEQPDDDTPAEAATGGDDGEAAPLTTDPDAQREDQPARPGNEGS